MKVIEGNINLSRSNLTVLPHLQDVSITGVFNCASNNLLSLIGCPKEVGSDFYCSNNELTSLEGAPKEVKGIFACGDNKVKFTEEQVRAVCKVGQKVYC